MPLDFSRFPSSGPRPHTSDHATKVAAYAGSIRRAVLDAGHELPSDEHIQAAATYLSMWRDLETGFRAAALAGFGEGPPETTLAVVRTYKAALAQAPARVA